jgi:hypothetical protein
LGNFQQIEFGDDYNTPVGEPVLISNTLKLELDTANNVIKLVAK